MMATAFVVCAAAVVVVAVAVVAVVAVAAVAAVVHTTEVHSIPYGIKVMVMLMTHTCATICCCFGVNGIRPSLRSV